MTVKIHKENVEHALVERGWKVTDLAKNAGLSWSTVYRAMDGNEFNSGTLEKMAKALDVNPIDLLSIEGGPTPLVGAPSVAAMAA